ncbi:M48 family metallopeptidase [Chromobacterium sp. IIBBL 290-4]|uniref:M48 family metallopeptidase n=1 Tax=Chromobacterium sp. IIBBL 290-4 TaxID=2953890 RepID=UPI0020B87666|nr:M48 family metallopeptidase [Chromobacterium sp. IIBBL 290-4]UTH75788.1 M48 family metallopeptidase [Chromobacterium sp. IIBBL 290-4]
MAGKQSRWPRRLSAALLAVWLAACAQVNTTGGGSVGISRGQTMLLSSQEVEQMSAKSYAQQLGQARAKGQLNTDAELTMRVRRISQRLIAQTPTFRPDARNWRWEVNVLRTDDMNAYAMAGGKIMVYSGLVNGLKLSDAELAAVIGHEISHALREHTRENMSQAYAQQLGLSLVGALAGLSADQMQLASMVTDVTLNKPHSRTMESEADIMGLELMARAGYDPNAAVNVWKKMQSAGNGGGPEFLSTHPSGPTRIRDLQARIPQVWPLYQVAAKG